MSESGRDSQAKALFLPKLSAAEGSLPEQFRHFLVSSEAVALDRMASFSIEPGRTALKKVDKLEETEIIARQIGVRWNEHSLAGRARFENCTCF